MAGKLCIIDGYSIIYRSYFAHMKSPMRNRDGVNIGAYFGFFSTLIHVLTNYKIDYIAVAMDEREPTFRHLMYPEYKATRDRAPEDLHAQIPFIRDTLAESKITVLSKSGFEADDIIASLSEKVGNNKTEVLILTSDKDIMQLVGDGISVLRPKDSGYQKVEREGVKEIYGVYPEQIVDYLTMLGDASDNIPGIKGIGEKSASTLLSEYLTLDGVYRHLDVLSPSTKKKLEEGRESAKLSSKLIVLRKDALEEDLDFDSLSTERISIENLAKCLNDMGCPSLARRIPGAEVSSPVEAGKNIEEGKYSVLQSDEEISKTVSSFDDGFVSVVPFEGGLGISFGAGTGYLIPDSVNPGKIFDSGIPVIAHDVKSLIAYAARIGREVGKIEFDTMIAAWLLRSDENKYDINSISSLYLGRAPESAAEAADFVYRLYEILLGKIRSEKKEAILRSMELPLTRVLSKMEGSGVKLSLERMEKLREDTEAEVKGLEEDVFRLSGKKFNLNSPMQLSDVLFVDLALPTPDKKTKSGYSTDTSTLEGLREAGGEIIEKILRYRLVSKLKSTYVDPLPEMVDSDGRIHTTFLQTGTATGRLSSRNPNLQNIPIRTDDGRKIRSAFLPEDGCIFLSADYSQIELTVLAHLSKDPGLREAFIGGHDIHRYTASLVFNKSVDEVTDHERQISKTINFGIIYGMSAHRLSGEIGVGRREAQEFINMYFERYRGVKDFIESTYEKARNDGKVSTLFSHERYIPGINSRNHAERSAAERIAVNTVVQGTAAEIMKKAMIEIDREMTSSGCKSRAVLQVHDELIFEVPYDELDRMEKMVKEKMEGVVRLSVPLRVSIETGQSWGDMH